MRGCAGEVARDDVGAARALSLNIGLRLSGYLRNRAFRKWIARALWGSFLRRFNVVSNKADGVLGILLERAFGLQSYHHRIGAAHGAKAMLAQHGGKVTGSEMPAARQSGLLGSARRR